jgi:hypothetical protein
MQYYFNGPMVTADKHGREPEPVMTQRASLSDQPGFAVQSSPRFRPTRLLRRWPQFGRTRWERIRLSLSRYLFREALRREWKSPRALASITSVARQYVRRHESDRTAEPPAWQFRVLQIGFSDIYLAEDFDQLAHGLSRLRDAAVRRRVFDTQQQDDWLRELKTQSGGGARNFGIFDVSLLPSQLRPRYVASLQVWVTQISSSVVVVNYIARPTKALTDRFRLLAETNRPEEAEIRRFSLVHGITRLHILLPENERRLEFDEVFASANAELTRILRHYVRCGMAMSVPLQQTRVVAFDQPVDQLPDSNFSSNTPHSQLRPFLRTLRYTVQPWSDFHASWYRLAAADGDRGHRRRPAEYVLLASSSSYLANGATRMAEVSDDDQMRHELEDLHRSLGVLASVEALYEHLRLAVLRVRNEIAPLLHSQSASRGKSLSLSRMQANQARLNELALREERVWAEVVQSPLWCRLAEGAADAVRAETAELHVSRASFAEYVKHIATMGHEFVETQVQLIRPAYREVLEYHALKANDKLQRRMALLTAVATVAAIAAVPESVILRVFEWLLSWFY